MISIRFRYDLLLRFFYGFVLHLWFSYGFSMFQLRFWYSFTDDSCSRSKLCYLKPTHRSISKIVSKSYQNRNKIVTKSYQNRNKIVSKSYQNLIKTTKIHEKTHFPGHSWIVSVSFCWSQRVGTISKSKNHIKTVAKWYQNCIKTLSKPRKSTRKRIFLDCFCFLLLKPTCRNHIKIEKSYQNCVKIVSKSFWCQNHKNPGEIRKKCPWAVSASFCGSQPIRNLYKISKPYQIRTKIVSKPYQNRIQTVTRTISKS